MLDKKAFEQAVNEWLEGRDYFLVDLSVSADDRVVVVIDHAEGVWIEDCADLSRHIQSCISQDDVDYELEVGSAGLGQPFRVHRQYEIHVGKTVECQTKDGRKLRGILTAVEEDGFDITVQQKVRLEGKKRPQMVETPMHVGFGDVVYTKYLIKMK